MIKPQTALESAGVRKFITAVILFNAVILGLETSDVVMASVGVFIGVLDRVCLAIFVVELALKLLVYRLRFFRDGWNIFDFVIGSITCSGGSKPVCPAVIAYFAYFARGLCGATFAPGG